MNGFAIEVRGLGKRYRLGGSKAETLRERLVDSYSRISHRGKEREKGDRDLWALSDVSFRVRKGEVLGIIGKNGAGKSTLLKILSQITPPTTGEAEIEGRVASLLEVGTGFHPELTGRENIYLNSSVLGMSRRETDRHFQDIVDFAEIGPHLDTPVKRYSSGMFVRLGFSIAAFIHPEILILDEVLAVGDIAFQRKCLNRMGDEVRDGRTVLFVSHNMAAISRFCSRGILLEGGRLTCDGTPNECIQTYLQKLGMNSDNTGCFRVNQRALDGTRLRSVALTGIELLAADQDVPLLAVRTGDDIRIRLHYETLGSAGRTGIAFGVIIRSSMGVDVTRCFTLPYSGYEIPALEAKGWIDLIIPRLPLAAGRYDLAVRVTRPKIEILTGVDDAVCLDVEHGDFFGSGATLEQPRALVAIDHGWRHGTLPLADPVDHLVPPVVPGNVTPAT